MACVNMISGRKTKEDINSVFSFSAKSYMYALEQSINVLLQTERILEIILGIMYL